jgi:hypothetical protein
MGERCLWLVDDHSVSKAGPPALEQEYIDRRLSMSSSLFVTVPPASDRPVSTLLEPVTKMAALFAIICYAIGYLIAVINDSAHGFFEATLLRPRAVTAGLIFMLLAVLPISITDGAFFKRDPEVESESELEKLARFALGILDYSAACFAAGTVMLVVFTDNLHGAPLSRGRAFAFVAVVWVTSINGFVRFVARKFYRRRPIAWIAFSVVCLVGLTLAIDGLKGLPILRCLVWMVGVTAVVNPILYDVRRGLKFHISVPWFVAALLVAISLYSTYPFPYMKAGWGGGAPIATDVYLSKDSPVHPNEKVKAALLEASDSGFYVVFDGEQKATYVPRALVSAMEFTPSPK